MREIVIERYLVELARAKGGEVRKVRWVGRKGAPDRVVMMPGAQLIWVETKATGEQPEPHQAREHERMRRMGQRVEVVDSFARVDALFSSAPHPIQCGYGGVCLVGCRSGNGAYCKREEEACL